MLSARKRMKDDNRTRKKQERRGGQWGKKRWIKRFNWIELIWIKQNLAEGNRKKGKEWRVSGQRVCILNAEQAIKLAYLCILKQLPCSDWRSLVYGEKTKSSNQTCMRQHAFAHIQGFWGFFFSLSVSPASANTHPRANMGYSGDATEAQKAHMKE